MWFTLLYFFLAVLAFLLIGSSLRLLMSINWFAVWLKASLALSGIALGVFMLLAGWDVFSFTRFERETPVTTVQIRQTSEQNFKVTLNYADRPNEQAVFDLAGDHWQLDVKVLVWQGLPNWFGQYASYRLDRLSGRYQAVRDEHNLPRTVYALSDQASVLDLWYLASHYPALPGLKAKQGMSSYVPLRDGATFNVTIGPRGLIAYPLNAQASAALAAWQ